MSILKAFTQKDADKTLRAHIRASRHVMARRGLEMRDVLGANPFAVSPKKKPKKKPAAVKAANT